MIEFLCLAAAATGVGWLVRRRHRQRQAAGPPAGIPGMARRPAGTGRWRAGTLYADQGAGARWQPGRGPAVPLTAARATGLRVPTVREGISINPGSRIVTCALEGGDTMEIAVMPLDVSELLEIVPRDRHDPQDTA
ncbi:hypothetical protein [Streptomyces sp. RerS4]|uniref:hypothetical protein n=1 Tax=Streptomyces sp. RerS4 TaxID=2942449 RepID=UPI00201CADF8|nr:hypothetical protein [Streptomyces sp. RerS4]UQX00965.1 hypothetical protein M4D82_10805 [Streptomyces sp. RerS4]